MEIRTLRQEDVHEVANIWKNIFEESDCFVKWLFTHRFYPAYSSCVEERGHIISVIHGMPLPLRFQGKIFQGAMICGVATLPAYRGHGLMKKLMTYEMALLREHGIQLVTQTPVDPAIYYSCDQYPCTKTAHFVYEKRGNPVPALRDFDLDVALATYRHFAGRYNGIVWRDKGLMQLKTDDYLSDGIQPYMLESGAYCFAELKAGGMAECQELAYFNEDEVSMLLEAIPAHTVTGRLPADFINTKICMKWSVRKHAVLYPLDEEITTGILDVALSPGRKMERLCEGLNCFIWEEY